MGLFIDRCERVVDIFDYLVQLVVGRRYRRIACVVASYDAGLKEIGEGMVVVTADLDSYEVRLAVERRGYLILDDVGRVGAGACEIEEVVHKVVLFGELVCIRAGVLVAIPIRTCVRGSLGGINLAITTCFKSVDGAQAGGVAVAQCCVR